MSQLVLVDRVEAFLHVDRQIADRGTLAIVSQGPRTGSVLGCPRDAPHVSKRSVDQRVGADAIALGRLVGG